jgi:hypothetical protein
MIQTRLKIGQQIEKKIKIDEYLFSTISWMR